MTPGGDEYVQLLDASGSQTKRPLFGLSNEQLTEACVPLANLPTVQNSYLRHFTGSGTPISTTFLLYPKTCEKALIDAGFVVGLPEIAETFRSSDGTERYLIACGDRQTVETVWMPGGDGGEEGDGTGRG